MPFCTECGARHADDAKVCPACGEPVFQPPSDDELDEALAALPGAPALGDEMPDFDDLPVPSSSDDADATPTAEYMAEIDEVRAEIAAQSSDLQQLGDLSWSNPAAVAIREQFDHALERLHALTPPAELAQAHADFVGGAELLAAGFRALVDAGKQGIDAAATNRAEQQIAEATVRFLRGADALNEHFTLQEAGLGLDDEEFVLRNASSGSTSDLEGELRERDQRSIRSEADVGTPVSVDVSLDDLDAELDALGVGDEPVDALADAAAPTREDDQWVQQSVPLGADEPSEEEEAGEEEIPPLPPSLEELDLTDLDPAGSGSRSTGLGGPSASFLVPPTPKSRRRGESGYAPDVGGAWSTLGDPSADSLLLEIEGGWVRGRPQVYDAIERSVRSAVYDALRGAVNTRLRIEQEARASLERIAAERSRLLEEVESLRRDAHQLHTELADLRRTVTDLERERQMAMERRQQIFQDAESHRGQLLREIEQLSGQLDAMRRNIVSLLNMSLTGADESSSAPRLSAGPASATPPAEPPPAIAPTVASTVAPGGGEPVQTEVRISGVANLSQNMQIQRALKAIPGVAVEGQPRFRNGVLSANLRHEPGLDLAAALQSLPDAGLTPRGSPEPGVLELALA